MKVILTADVPGTGKKNQLVNVSDGYARNFLFPRKLAREASEGAIKEIERRNAAEAREEAQRLKEAEDLASSFKGKVVTLEVKAGEKGRLYGSVTTQEVADAIEKQLGHAIDRRKIELKEAIRNVGTSEATLRLYPGVTAQIQLKVVAK
jgi:large subunit ribosomal protein L9